MAQPNVAREPSMEEILASIRRIIESNDPIADAEMARRSDSELYDEEDEELDVAEELEESFVPQMAANDPGRPVAPAGDMRPAAETQPRVEPEKALSLADVAARVRAAAGRVPEPRAQEMRVPEPRMQEALAPQVIVRAAPVAASPVAQPVSQPVERVQAVERPGFEAPAEQRAAQNPVAQVRNITVSLTPPQQAQSPAPVAPQPQLSQAPAMQPVAQPLVARHDAQDAPLLTRIEEESGLLSDEAGAQIARSFGELADVFDGIERQSMEEIARDMLRPMLREWLDDNLPRLVERMVREEIERVARGPRR